MAVRIAHISDVHIRGLTRHDEQKIVLSDFIRQCEENKVDHIMITGDVWHSKLQGISPEAIDLLTWMFRSFADVAETHMIIGNHDMSVPNKSRQDILSSILTTMNDDRIHFYKNSGVYEFFPGYNFCVYSMYDEQNWGKVKPVPGMINIACYHGSVWGATTEQDWKIESDMQSSFFEGYDMTMLGDIHKHQFLDFRDVEIEIDEKDLSRYPGAEVVG